MDMPSKTGGRCQTIISVSHAYKVFLSCRATKNFALEVSTDDVTYIPFGTGQFHNHFDEPCPQGMRTTVPVTEEAGRLFRLSLSKYGQMRRITLR